MRWYQIENADGDYLVQLDDKETINFCSDNSEPAHAFVERGQAVEFVMKKGLLGCSVQVYS